MVQQGSVPRWLLLLILLIAIGIIGLAVVFLGPLVASWLSSPTVSSLMVEPMQLDANIEQASVSGHLECSHRTPLPEMRVVVYVTGVRPNQEGEWRRSKVPCVTEIGKEWTLSSNCTTFPKEYSAFSLMATLVMKDLAAYLPSKLVARDEDELRSKLLKYVYRCDDCAPCNCISPVVTVSRSYIVVAEAETPTPPAPAFTPTPTSTSSPAATHTPTITPIPPSPTSLPSPTLNPTPITPMATHTLPPALSPWNPTLPVPTAPPGYDPNVACVVNPCAPAPQLIDPQNGTEFIVNSSIELSWEWAYCLPPEWKFAIRISETSPHSYRYEDNPKLITCEDGKTVGRYRLPEDSRFRTTSGTYYWNIAVARSVEGGWERLSEYSETRWLVVKPGKPNGTCPVPPCP